MNIHICSTTSFARGRLERNARFEILDDFTRLDFGEAICESINLPIFGSAESQPRLLRRGDTGKWNRLIAIASCVSVIEPTKSNVRTISVGNTIHNLKAKDEKSKVFYWASNYIRLIVIFVKLKALITFWIFRIALGARAFLGIIEYSPGPLTTSTGATTIVSGLDYIMNKIKMY
uniref:Uncharacterized protein n=1 Tax=Glossina pallidipes TaxID=7398 RepID=A0A1A9ZLH5_GLOPL